MNRSIPTPDRPEHWEDSPAPAGRLPLGRPDTLDDVARRTQERGAQRQPARAGPPAPARRR